MYYPRFNYSKISMDETMNNTLDSLDFTDWIWGFQLNLSSIIIPKNLVAATRGNTTLLIFNATTENFCLDEIRPRDWLNVTRPLSLLLQK